MAMTNAQKQAKHRLAVKEKMAAMRHALELALPWLSPPLDDRDTSASGMAYRAVSDALGYPSTSKTRNPAQRVSQGTCRVSNTIGR